MRILIATERESQVWNSFVENHPHSSPYHTWEFGKAFSVTYDQRRYYFIAKTDNEIIGVFPLIHIRSRLFLNKLISLPFCEYGGPLINPNFLNSGELIEGLLRQILTLASFLGVDYIEVRNPSYGEEELQKQGFRYAGRYITLRIDLLKGKENLWRSLDKKTRNSTRKAMEKDLKIYEITKEDELKRYYSLYLKTQKKHGAPPHSYKLFWNLFRLNKGKGMKIVISEYNETPVAGAIFLQHKNVVYWWSGVSDQKFRHLNATNLILWKVMEWACEKGFKAIDLGRTRRYTSVYHFKSGWGGEEVKLRDYVHFLHISNLKMPDPYQYRYCFLSKIWSILPVSVAEKVGPRIVSGIGL
jgi:FemAB-related protein (PEP-CTERM system-associated)